MCYIFQSQSQCCNNAIFQTIPADSPTLVEPSLVKVDLERLKVDIKKYESAGVLDDNSIIYWKSFLGKGVQYYDNKFHFLLAGIRP